MQSKEKLNLDSFIIKRKRKKYKFAKFSNSNICFEKDQWQSSKVDCLEIGAGTGILSVELAKTNTNKKFLALDVKADRLQTGAYLAEEYGLHNVNFIRARADQISDFIKPDSLEQIWVTFPDPYPKKGSSGRRLTHDNFLRAYKKVLRNGGVFNFKTDDHNLFDWSLEQIVDSDFLVEKICYDVHDSNLGDDVKTTTTYEKRWIGEGKNIMYVKARKVNK